MCIDFSLYLKFFETLQLINGEALFAGMENLTPGLWSHVLIFYYTFY